MLEVFMAYVLLASNHVSYVYGFGENSCHGPCTEGVSRTASGDLLSKNIPSVAVPIPKGIPLQIMWIGLRTQNGKCTLVKINDRTSYALVGKRGFDLSPAAQKAITGIRSKTWSGRLELCDPAPAYH